MNKPTSRVVTPMMGVKKMRIFATPEDVNQIHKQIDATENPAVSMTIAGMTWNLCCATHTALHSDGINWEMIFSSTDDYKVLQKMVDSFLEACGYRKDDIERTTSWDELAMHLRSEERYKQAEIIELAVDAWDALNV